MLETLAALPLGAVLREVARRYPARVAMIGEDRQWTWAELDNEVDQVAAMWEAEGITPGMPIGFLLSKRPEVVIGFLACARTGALFVPVNFKLPLESIQDQLATARVRALMIEPGHAKLATELRKSLPDILSGPTWDVDRQDSYGRHHEYTGKQASFVETLDTPCYLNYTSGSTGRPKGAITTHRNIQANAIATIRGLGFQEQDVYLGMFSVFAHPHELFHRSILFGGTFVVVDSLNPRIIAEIVAKHRVTWMMAVPSFYEMMLEAQEQGEIDLSSLRVLESGGAYVSPETLERMEHSFKATFLPVWGSTETTGVGLGMRIDQPRRPGSTGKPIDGYQIRVVRESGEDCDIDEAGELLISGDAVVSGYINQPEESEKHFSGGWYATRDLVRRDADGYLYFVGRRSEMLKIGGIRVFPLEIEQVIKAHPEVRDVVVVRAEERLRGEIARAVVSTVPGSTLTVRGVQAWCRARLALYMVPRMVEFWREVPKLPNGKIDKKAVSMVAPDAARDERHG